MLYKETSENGMSKIQFNLSMYLPDPIRLGLIDGDVEARVHFHRVGANVHALLDLALEQIESNTIVPIEDTMD